ncbi:hypothetical protein [Chryseobacterium limigenitum]|nr:hypothetical protein [Chryseobacterium limigenitum]
MYDYVKPHDEKKIDLYNKFAKLNYSSRVNKNGITIHNINGVAFVSMDNPTIKPQFMMKDLNNDPEDYTKGKSFANLNKNPIYAEILKKSDAKEFNSLEESNLFQFKLMQTIAKQLGWDVWIDADFVDRPQNEDKVKDILACLHALTGVEMWIPYKIDERGLSSIMHCQL